MPAQPVRFLSTFGVSGWESCPSSNKACDGVQARGDGEMKWTIQRTSATGNNVKEIYDGEFQLVISGSREMCFDSHWVRVPLEVSPVASVRPALRW